MDTSPFIPQHKLKLNLKLTTYIMAGSYVSFLDVTPRHYGAQTARHNLKTFPPAHLLHNSSPQPQSTLTIPVIINFFHEWQKRTCQKWNHDVKNETIMSKLCQTCQKSSTNPQRANFHFVKIHAEFCLHQWKMKCSIWSTHDFHEWQILSPKLRHQNFDTLTNFIIKNKNNANLFLI